MQIPNKLFFEDFKKTSGAFSVSECIALYNICQTAPEGLKIELGVNRGKSAFTAAAAFCDAKIAGEFLLVEPEFVSEEWEQSVLNLLDRYWFNGTKFIPVAGYSTDVLPKYKMYSFCFVDSGSHGDGLPMREVKMIEDRMMPNGVVGFHDYKSQFSEVEQAYNYLVGTGKYKPIEINWDEINRYVIDNNLNEGNNSWHHTELECPNFLGALKRKQ